MICSKCNKRTAVVFLAGIENGAKIERGYCIPCAKEMNISQINDLIEKGFIKAMEGRMIALHPMMQEVTAEETKPSVQTCNTLLDSLQQICLRHGEEVSYYKQLFQTIESVIAQIENDDI